MERRRLESQALKTAGQTGRGLGLRVGRGADSELRPRRNESRIACAGPGRVTGQWPCAGKGVSLRPGSHGRGEKPCPTSHLDAAVTVAVTSVRPGAEPQVMAGFG